MKNHPIIGYLILAAFFLTSPLSATCQEQKPHVGYGPNAIDRVDEKYREAFDRSLANFLNAINTNSFDSCYSVDFDYLQSEWNPFLFLDNAQKGGKHGWILRFEWCQPFRSDDASYYGSNDAILV